MASRTFSLLRLFSETIVRKGLHSQVPSGAHGTFAPCKHDATGCPWPSYSADWRPVRRYPCRRISSLPPTFPVSVSLFHMCCISHLFSNFFASLIFLGARDVTKASARSFRARLYPRTALRALGRSGVRRERDLPLRLKKRTQKGAYDTGYSQAVTHPSTNPPNRA